MKKVLAERWFLILLVSVLVAGIAWSGPLEGLSEIKPLRNAIVATVLFLMALPLEARAIYRAFRRPGPPMLASIVNMGWLPLTGWVVSGWLSPEMGAGLLVAVTTPCTLASASVWTRRAGGNDAVSILVTMATNSTCFLVTPLWLVAMTGQAVESEELSLSRMSVRLGLLVVLPMAIAQLLRLRRPVGDWATRHKRQLSVLAQFGILSMVFLGAIRTGLRLSQQGTQQLLLWDFATMLLAVVGLHLIALYTAVGLGRLCRFAPQDRVAVAFAGSQKTLMVGLLVAMSLQVSILPMVAYHISQLFVDTLIADRWRKSGATGEDERSAQAAPGTAMCED